VLTDEVVSGTFAPAPEPFDAGAAFIAAAADVGRTENPAASAGVPAKMIQDKTTVQPAAISAAPFERVFTA
jgi:hypothetical protein